MNLKLLLFPLFILGFLNAFTQGLTADNPVCLDETATILYSDPVAPGSLLNWNFSGGRILSGNGKGPFEISWSSPGAKRILLEVIENGDTAVHSLTVDVVAPLEAPEFSCEEKITGLEICWTNVEGATGFTVTAVNGSGFITDGCFTFTSVDPGGGDPGIILEIDGEEPCGSLTVEYICEPVDCPPVILTIQDAGPFCIDARTVPVLLRATATGSTGNGVFTWRGPGLNPGGRFDPVLAGPGSHEVIVLYEEGDCSWEFSQIIEVHSAPEINHIYMQTPLFIGQFYSTIRLNISGSGSFTYQWSGPNGFEYNRRDLTNLVLAPGEYCVTITNEEGCRTDTCLTIEEPFLQLSPVHLICEGRSKRLNIKPGGVNANFEWRPSTGLSCSNCPDPIASPNRSTTYRLQVTLPDGRTGSMDVWVIVLPAVFCPSFRSAETAINNLIRNEAELDLIVLEKTMLESIGKEGLMVYPNPFKSEFSIFSPRSDIQSVELLDWAGRVLLFLQVNDQACLLSPAELSSGIYWLRVKTSEGMQMKKVVRR